MKEEKVGWEPREVGKKYMLDRDFRNRSIVTVVQSGRMFARVKDDDGNTWQVMVNRLTELKDNEIQ